MLAADKKFAMVAHLFGAPIAGMGGGVNETGHGLECLSLWVNDRVTVMNQDF